MTPVAEGFWDLFLLYLQSCKGRKWMVRVWLDPWCYDFRLTFFALNAFVEYASRFERLNATTENSIYPFVIGKLIWQCPIGVKSANQRRNPVSRLDILIDVAFNFKWRASKVLAGL